MRYFKCEPFTESDTYRQQYAELKARDEESSRKWRVRGKLGFAVCVLVAGLVLGGGWLLAKLLVSTEQPTVLLTVLATGARIVLSIVVVIAALALGLLAGSLFWKQNGDNQRSERRLLLRKGCEQYREYYGFREPYLLTKCFDSSDKRFRKHDICLFTVDGELRLTVNLQYGFFDPDRDLGCYGFSREELAIEEAPWEEHPAVKLTAGETTFLLGSRTLPFLDKCWDV